MLRIISQRYFFRAAVAAFVQHIVVRDEFNIRPRQLTFGINITAKPMTK